MPNLLLLTASEKTAELVEKVCAESGWTCRREESGGVVEGGADAVVVDLEHGLGDGDEVVREIGRRSPFMPVIFVNKEHGPADDFGDGLRYYIDPAHITDLEHILISLSCGFRSGDVMEPGRPDTGAVPRVLIVDDNLELANLIERSVRALERYDVRVTGSGFEAASILPMFQPDVVVIDLVLDDMDGREVCSFIRNHEDLKKTRIIGVSGYLPEGSVSDAGPLFDVFLEKPFRVKDVVDQIVKLVQG
ncbi:MAG: response regulator [Candidatus Hydrogenedentes bacterium]|nr:response regulator [Candidatus Hydrogenedentota bacterium]